jgi:hypothetical protein
MTTEEDHAGLGPASNIGGGQLIGRSWSRSTDLGHTLHAAQPTQITGPAEHLLGLLSHSRPRPSTTSNTIVSRVIRLSQLRVEASRRGKSGMWRPSDTDNGFLSPEPLAAATSLALAGLKRFANVPRSLKY